MITIPRVSEKSTHLINVKNVWYCMFFEDGKIRRKSLGTDNRAEALQRRDSFYSGLVEQGASVVKTLTPAEKVKRDCDKYVYYRDPWIAKINSITLGYAKTKKEAQAIRDAYLK